METWTYAITDIILHLHGSVLVILLVAGVGSSLVQMRGSITHEEPASREQSLLLGWPLSS